MRVEEIDALLGGEAQRLADQYREMPLDFMDGYGWAVTQICRLFHDAVPVRHGKWLPREEGVLYPFWERYTCSECGKHSDDTRYCSNCGAKMKPCDDCQEFDCYGCEYAERKEE